MIYGPRQIIAMIPDGYLLPLRNEENKGSSA
jgi:hypothetical protein